MASKIEPKRRNGADIARVQKSPGAPESRPVARDADADGVSLGNDDSRVHHERKFSPGWGDFDAELYAAAIWRHFRPYGVED